jgi:hypothetical protein
VQFRVINEFEQLLSASMSVTCFDRRPLRRISPVFTEDFLGSPTGIGLMIDHFTDGAVSSSANEPFLRDGRSAVLRFP